MLPLRITWLLGAHLLCHTVQGQWQLLDGGVDRFVRCYFKDTLNERMLIGGNFHLVGDEGLVANKLAWWNGDNWSTEGLGNGSGDTTEFGSAFPVLSAVARHDTIFASYASNSWHNDLSMRFAAMYANGEWQPCGDPNNTFFFLHEQGRLFCGGENDSLYGNFSPGILEWRDGGFQPIPNMPFTQAVGVYCVEHWRGQFYFGGIFDAFGSSRVVAFDGVDQWTGLGNGVGGYHVSAICGFGDSLFVGGWFQGVNVQSPHLQLWDGAEWHPFFPHVEIEGPVLSMDTHDGAMYIAAVHRWVGEDVEYGILRFDGQRLCSVGGPISSTGRLVLFNEELYWSGSPAAGPISGEYIARLRLDQIVPDRCVEVATTMEQQELEARLTAFPNPTTGLVTIALPEFMAVIEVQLFDASGRLVLNRSFSRTNTCEFDIKGIANGTYHALVRAGDRRWELPVLKLN